MKKIIGFLVLTFALFHNTAKAEMIEGLEVSRPAQGINFTHSVDVSRYDTLGVQAVYSDGTPAVHTITSGVKEVGTIDITNTSGGLIAARASLTIAISSVAGVVGDSVVLNGVVFTEGTHWTVGASSAASASNLAVKIDAHNDFAATVAGSTITVFAQSTGAFANGWPATTTDATRLTLSAATFTGGKTTNYLIINGVTLTEGIDFSANSSSRTTMGQLATAIGANATLAAQVLPSSSSTGALLTLTAINPAIANYYIVSSTTGYTVANFAPGATSEVNITSDLFTEAAHSLTTGLAVRFSTVAASTLGGLTNQTTYFAIKLTDNTYKLATTTTTAAAGTAIDLTSVPTTASAYTITPCPLVLVGGNGFYWDASNDGSNFTNLTGVTVNGVAVTSVTYSAAGNSLYNFGSFPYKYLRMVFSGPTRGGIAIAARFFGREE